MQPGTTTDRLAYLIISRKNKELNVAKSFKRASLYQKPIIGVFGIIEDSNEDYNKYFCKIYETNYKHLPFEEVKKHTKRDLIGTIKKIDF